MPSLPLDTWRAITGYHPLHFWGMVDPQLAPVLSTCNDVVREYDWQSAQRVGRRDIETYLDQADALLTTHLRYAVAARAVEFADVPVRGGKLALPEGYIQAIGREVLTLVDSPAVAYSDADSDGLIDTATIIATLTAADAEVVLQFPESDRVAGQREDWRVLRSTISIVGLVATITLPSRVLVKPNLYETLALQTTNGIAPNTAANYITNLAVYERTVDATDAVTIGGTSVTATICDAKHGVLVVDRGCGYDWAYCGTCGPHICTHRSASVAVIAGLPLVDGLPQLYWRRILAQLAAALIPGTLCECKQAETFLHKWQFDVSRIGNPQEEFAFKEQAINNPLGPQRGAIAAWQAIEDAAHARGIHF